MKIAITGASGMVGSALTKYFITHGSATVVALGREFVSSDLEGCDAVINLAGASIAEHWTAQHMQLIVDSRVNTSRRLVSCIAQMTVRPRVVVSASAVAIYSDVGCHDERSDTCGDTFLSDVCRKWETAITDGMPEDVRLVITRLSLVISPCGGMLPKIESSTILGFCPVLGNRHKSMSWIAIDDLVRAFDFIIFDSQLCGPVNMCAPYPTTQEQVADQICALHGTPYKVHIPNFIVRLVVGEGFEVINVTQCTTPKALLINGFKFKYPTIQGFFIYLGEEKENSL